MRLSIGPFKTEQDVRKVERGTGALPCAGGFWLEHDRAPLVRKICKTTGLKLKTIYELFPSGPAKGACKLAGLPSPEGCV